MISAYKSIVRKIITTFRARFKKPRIIIAVSHLHYNDSISNCIFAMYENFKKANFKAYITAGAVDKELEQLANIKLFRDFENDDIVILHYGGMNNYIREILSKELKIIIYYHNVTPAVYFKNYDSEFYNWLADDDSEFIKYRAKYKGIVCVSDYSKNKLQKMNFQNIGVIPILFDFARYEKYNETLYNSLAADSTKYLIFTGIILPHKNQLELLRIFNSFLIRYKMQKVKLILIGGNSAQIKKYYDECIEFINENNLAGKIKFTGKISDEDRNAYYKAADLYVSASLHEGFGIPLIESMYFNIPVIAYSNGAVPETLADTGHLIDCGDIEGFADKIHELLNTPDIKAYAKKKYEQSLKKYSPVAVEEKWIEYLKDNI